MTIKEHISLLNQAARLGWRGRIPDPDTLVFNDYNLKCRKKAQKWISKYSKRPKKRIAR